MWNGGGGADWKRKSPLPRLPDDKRNVNFPLTHLRKAFFLPWSWWLTFLDNVWKFQFDITFLLSSSSQSTRSFYREEGSEQVSMCGSVCVYICVGGRKGGWWTGNWAYELNSQLKYRNRKALKYPGLIHILGKNPLRHLSWLSEFGSRAESSDLEGKMKRTIARGQKETIPDYHRPWGWGEGIVNRSRLYLYKL